MKNNKLSLSIILKSLERISAKGLGLVVSIVLARILTPEDFGQIAIITVFINLCNVFVDSGLSSALVQKKETDELDYSTVLIISLGVAAILSIAIILCAPLIGEYYENEALILPLQVYSGMLIINSLSSVQNAKLQKEMKFKVVLYTSLISTALSGAVGISMACLGAGIWALIGYYYAHAILYAVLILCVEKWMPAFAFSWSKAKELFSFGWKMLVSGLLCSLYNDIRTLVIGKISSEQQLGYYNKGSQFPSLIAGTAESTISAVIFPAVSSVQDDKEEVVKLTRTSLQMGSFILIPLMLGLCVTAKPFVQVILTDKWLPAVSYMQIICIGSASIAIMSSNLTAIKSLGRSDIYMKLEFVRRMAMLAVLLITIFVFGTVEAIAWGYAISAWIDILIISIPVKKLINYGPIAQCKDIWKIIFASLVMAAVTFAFGFIPLPAIVMLIMQVFIGAILYILMCFVLKIEAFVMLKNKAVEMIKR